MKNVILFRKELYLNIFQRSIILFIELHYLKKKKRRIRFTVREFRLNFK